MAQHISRKELKKDEIRETLSHGAEAVISHGKLFGSLAAAAVIVILAVVGWKFYTARQTVKASAEMEDAMRIFQARIRTAGEPAQPGEVTYVDEKNKYTDAAKKFTEIAGKYPHTRPGQMSLYYAALSEEQLDQYADAEKKLAQLQGSASDDFAALARFELAQVYEKTGKGDEAAKLYRELADHPTTLVPKAVVLLALADHYSQNNVAEAVKLYNQVKSEFPDSAAAEQADKQLELLAPKS